MNPIISFSDQYESIASFVDRCIELLSFHDNNIRLWRTAVALAKKPVQVPASPSLLVSAHAITKAQLRRTEEFRGNRNLLEPPLISVLNRRWNHFLDQHQNREPGTGTE